MANSMPMRSTNPIEECGFTWIIENVSTTANQIQSDTFASSKRSSKWYLDLKFTNDLENGYYFPLTIALQYTESPVTDEEGDGDDSEEISLPGNLKKAKFNCDTCIFKSNGAYCAGYAFTGQSMKEKFCCLELHEKGDYTMQGGVVKLFGLKDDKMVVKFSMEFSGHEEVRYHEHPSVSLSNLSSIFALMSDMKDFYKSGQSSDVIFQVSGRELRAHKAIISARSDVLAKMLDTDMLEKKTSVVNLPDTDAKVFEQFLFYLYCGEIIEDRSVQNIVQLYSVADKYHVPSLKKACRKILTSSLRVEDACSLLKFSVLYYDDELKAGVKKFMFHHLSDVAPSAEWSDIRQSNAALASEVLEFVNFASVYP